MRFPTNSKTAGNINPVPALSLDITLYRGLFCKSDRIDLRGFVGQNTPVRRIMAWNAALALLLATFYAPLFHVHSDAGGAPLLHAHLPEIEISGDETVVHMEPLHSHAAARSIDILTTVAAQSIHHDAIIESTFFALIDREPSPGFVPSASPRAHAPPVLEFLIPRAPPA